VKKLRAPEALAAARLGLVQAGAFSTNPIYKPQPDPWIPVFVIPVVVVTPIGY
jgi:hypothetical protein